MKSTQQKREEATERNKRYQRLTTQQKLALLPSNGATKQRKRLEALLTKESEEKK